MATGLAKPGEYHSSEVIALDGQDARIRLDRLRPPRTIERPAWLLEHTLVSQRMLEAGFTVDQATQRFLVGLPPGYWTSKQRYPVIYVSHGFSGHRWAYLDRYKVWREEMKERPAILVSLDSDPRKHAPITTMGPEAPRATVREQDLHSTSRGDSGLVLRQIFGLLDLAPASSRPV